MNIQLTVTTAAGANVGIGLGVALDPIVGTFSMAIGTIQVGANFVTNPTQYTYQITQPEYVVRAVEMPPPYIASLQKRIQSDQLQLDIPTYSTYLATPSKLASPSKRLASLPSSPGCRAS